MITVEEYLTTSFPDGDREYVDGQIVERNVGEHVHVRNQALMLASSWFTIHNTGQVSKREYEWQRVATAFPTFA